MNQDRPLTEPVTNRSEPAPKELRFFPVNTARPRTLTTAQMAAYNRDGYLAPLGVFSPAEADRNREFFDHLMAESATLGWDRYSLVNFEFYSAYLFDLATDNRILDVVEDLLGPNFVCFGTHFFCKTPGDSKRVAWHQDAPYYQLTPSKSLTAWLAIDDVDEENSAMQVIPGSHLHGEIAMVESAADEESILGRTVPNAVSHGQPVSVNLRAGQISIHSDMLLHGSEPNRSARRRCGLAIRYLPVDVKALTNWNELSIHCRGTDPAGDWAHHGRPAGNRIPRKPATGGAWPIVESVPMQAAAFA